MTNPHTPETDPTLASDVEALNLIAQYEAYADMPDEAKAVANVVHDATGKIARQIFGDEALVLQASPRDNDLLSAHAFTTLGDYVVSYDSAMFGHSSHRRLVVSNKDRTVVLFSGDETDAFFESAQIAVHEGRVGYATLMENKRFVSFGNTADQSAILTTQQNTQASTEVRVSDKKASVTTQAEALSDIVATATEMIKPVERRARMRKLMESLSVEEKTDLLVEQLGELSDGFKPLPVFMALIEKNTLPTVEMVPLRTNPTTGRTEVLLTQRPEDDPWSNEWHVPGSAILPMDLKNQDPNWKTPYERTFGRLLNADGELRAGVKPTFWPPVELRTEGRDTRRSTEVSIVHYVEVEGEPTVGMYVPVGETIEVPDPNMVVIDHHQQFIIDAARDYEQKRAANEAQGLQA